VKYLLDTHGALWAAEGDSQLGQSARKALLSASYGDAFISEITLLEIAMLAKKGRIRLEIAVTEYLTRLQALYQPVRTTPTVAALAMDLQLPQGDPFDRVIVAAAIDHDLTLITRDQHIIESGLVPTLW